MGARHYSAAEIVENTSGLVTLPDIFLRIKAVVDAPGSSLEDVANVISTDAALVARLLKIANSSFFGFPSRIETVPRAVTLLGTQQIHDLVLATSMGEVFSDVESDVMSLSEFWQVSMRCGILARLLAMRCNVLDSERLFVEGLLHDIGHLLMYRQIPTTCAEAVQQSRDESMPLYRCEDQLIGCNYAQVGAELMRRWNFPPALIESTACQNNPAASQHHGLESALVHIAVCMKNQHISGAGESLELGGIDPVAWQRTGLAAADMAAILCMADAQLESTLATLFPRFRRSA